MTGVRRLQSVYVGPSERISVADVIGDSRYLFPRDWERERVLDSIIDC